jgi:hypothetical protein
MNPTEMMQKVAEVAPKEYAFFKKAAAEISKGPFADEVKEELDGIMKKAMSALSRFGGMMGGAAKSTGSFLGGVGAAAGTAAAGGIALALAGDAYNAAKRGLTKSMNYRAMLEANPDLREVPADRVQRAFSTLHHLNPQFSGDPTVAGSFVRRQSMSDIPDWDPNQLKTIIDSHKSLSDTRKLPNFDPRIMQSREEHPFKMEELRQKTDAEFQRAMKENPAQNLGNELRNIQMIDDMQQKGFDPQKVDELRKKMRAMGG